MANGFNIDDKIVKRPADDVPLNFWQEDEWMKCALDKYYFFENYVYVQGEHGKTLFKPRAYQNRVIDESSANRFTISLMGRQSGKCQLSNTKALTSITIGDTLYELEMQMGDLHNLSKCQTQDDALILIKNIQGSTNEAQ